MCRLYTTFNGQQAKIEVEVRSDSVGSYPRLVENLIRHLDGDPTAEIVRPEQVLTSVETVDGIMRSAASGREIVM